MLSFLAVNLGTIVISLILIGIIAAIVRKIVKDKKNGISCSSGCSGCTQSKNCKR